MKYQFKVDSSKLDKCLEALSAVITSKSRGDYFEPREVIRKSKLSKDYKEYALKDDSWIEFGVINGYLEEVQYLGYKLGKKGMAILKQVENIMIDEGEKPLIDGNKPKEFKFSLETIALLVRCFSDLIKIETYTNLGHKIVNGILELLESWYN